MYNTHYTNIKHYKHNSKVSPFGIAVIKKKWAITLGNDGIIVRFDLAFQYQIFFKPINGSTKTVANENYYINA